MKIKQFIKTVLIFFTGNVLSKIIAFLLLPLYTQKIDPAQFGNYDVALSFINLVVPIAFFQVWDGMYRISFDYEKDSDKHIVISNSMAISFFGIVLYFLLFSLLEVFFNFAYFPYVLIYGVLFAFNYVYTYSARVFLFNKLFVFSGVVASITTAVLNIILILGFNWDVKSIYVSAILGLLVQQLIIEIKLGVIRNFRLSHINKALIKQMMRFSIPLCVATISYWLLSGYTKILIQNLIGDYANGVYAVTNKFGSLITLVVTVLQFAWNETVYIIAIDSKEDRGRSYTLCVNIMTIGIIFSTSIFCLAAKIVFPYIINSQYHEALNLIPPTIIGVAANSLAGFIGTLFMAEKKNNFIMISTCVSSAVNIVLGYVLTKQFQLYGAIIALMISFVLLASMRLGKVVRKFNFNIFLEKKIIVFDIILLLLSVIGFYTLNSIIFEMLLIVVICILFILLIKKYIKLLFNAIKEKKIA